MLSSMFVAQHCMGQPNYALEWSVKVFSERAAGARKILAPAAPGRDVPRPVQRGR
jgi:hypothetical protein